MLVFPYGGNPASASDILPLRTNVPSIVLLEYGYVTGGQKWFIVELGIGLEQQNVYN